MNMSFSRVVLWGLMSLPGLAFGATPHAPEVVVVGDLTKVGEQGRIPDAAHPVYYVPLAPADPKKDATTPDAGKQPTKAEVMNRLAAVLAKRNYLPAGPGHPPELAISFWWGTADPQLENFGTDDAQEE